MTTKYRIISRLTKKPFFLFLLIALGFFFLKLTAVAPRLSDENWYFHATSLIMKGVLPYRDFFIAYYPTQIMLYASLAKIFGFDVTLFKVLQLLMTIASSWLLFLLLRRINRATLGLYAAVFFLFSYLILWTSDYVPGVHEATFFLLLSWYLLPRSAPLAGLSLFVGLTIRRYILPAAIGFIALEAAKRNWRRVFSFLAFSLIPFFLVNLALFFKFGQDFITQVWRYHFLKFTASHFEDIIPIFIRNDWVLLLFSSVGIWLVFRKAYNHWRKKKSFGRDAALLELGLSASLAFIMQFLFLHFLSIVFPIYFVTLMGFMAVMSALTLQLFLPVRSRRLALLMVTSLSLFNVFFYIKDQAQASTIPKLDEIVADIEAITEEEETIFGSYVITPLLALEAGREITDNQTDTNFQRFLTGLFPADEATRVATQSALFIQEAQVSKEGILLRLRPYYVDQRVIADSCDLYKTYRLERAFEFNLLLVWECSM